MAREDVLARHWMFVFLFSLFFCSPNILLAAESIEPAMTMNRMIEGLRAREAAWLGLDEFFIHYQRVGNTEVTPCISSGYVCADWKFARQHDQWYSEQAFLEDDAGNRFKVPEDIRTTLMHSGMRAARSKDFGQVSIMFQSNDSLSTTNSEFFWQQGINIYRAIVADAGLKYDDIADLEIYREDLDHPFMPETLLDNQEHYVLHPQQEPVDGVPCWVLEWEGMDKCWVDSECGFAIRKRIYHWEPGGPPKYKIVSKDFREEFPGIWVPWTQLATRYTSIHAEEPALWGKVASELRYEVVEVDLEHAPDNLFTLELPAGTLVNDIARDMVYRVAEDGADPFDDPLQVSSRLVSRHATMRAVITICAALVLVLVAWLLARREKSS